jgi:hypothetical protein
LPGSKWEENAALARVAMGGVFRCAIWWRPLIKLLCAVTFVMARLFL